MPGRDGVAEAFTSQIERVLILGHTGLIGGNLLRAFRAQSPPVEMEKCSLPSVDLTQEDDVRTLATLFDARTAVVICSAIKKQFGDSLKTFLRNLKMITNLCGALERRPVRRVVYFSSAEVYGDVNDMRITETTPVSPASYYGVAKYASERLLWKTIEGGGASSLLIVRPPLVYGPGDRTKGYGPSGFVWAAINRQTITLWGDGGELREFVYVEDVAEIVRRLTFLEYAGMVNIASGESRTFRDVLESVVRLVPFDLKVDSRPRTRPRVNHGFDNSLLRALLPGVSFTSLEEGVRRTFEAESSLVTSGAGSGAERGR